MSWDQFCDNVKKAAGTAADKINQTADLASLQVKLSIAEHKLNEAYTELGRASYNHFSNQENGADAVATAMTGVGTAKKAVDDLQEQINRLKKS